MRVIAAILLGMLGGCREASSAEPAAKIVEEPAEPVAIEAPCAGCEVYVPRRSGDAVPLVVVLHGDRETASDWARRWQPIAAERGWAVLALQCPADACPDAKWYQWNGDPAWVVEQVDHIAKAIDIDRAKTFLVAWSGGASYVGMHAPSWERFAAVVFHGGGDNPADEAACPTRLPAYFLVGDGNPFHGAAKRLRDYLEGCGQAVTWDLQPGADHARENAALDAAKANAILDWLDTHAKRA